MNRKPAFESVVDLIFTKPLWEIVNDVNTTKASEWGTTGYQELYSESLGKNTHSLEISCWWADLLKLM
jgi:hypothetical protein